MGIDETVARDEITQLCYRYAWALDSRDLDALVACFVPGAVTRKFWDESLRPIRQTPLSHKPAAVTRNRGIPQI